MKVSKAILLSALLPVGLGGCFYNDDYYGQQGGYNYGAPPQGTYGTQDPNYGTQDPYGGSTAPGVYGNPQGNPYGSDVVTIPGDGSGTYAPSGGNPSNAAPGAVYSGAGNAVPAGRIYTVQKGDNLYRLGKKHGVSMQAIIEQNGLQSTTIHPGQQLIIP